MLNWVGSRVMLKGFDNGLPLLLVVDFPSLLFNVYKSRPAIKIPINTTFTFTYDDDIDLTTQRNDLSKQNSLNILKDYYTVGYESCGSY